MATSVEGVDYSFDRPSSATALRQAGKHFAARYLAIPPNGKIITRAEADDLAAAGVWIVATWEQSGHGAVTARDAAKYAQDAAHGLGIPEGRPIYVAVDYDAQAGDYARIWDWVAAFDDSLGPWNGRALYGGYYVIRDGFNGGHLDYAWQTLAWSGGNLHPQANIYQYSINQIVAGAAVDLDRAYTPDYGQWMPGIAPERAGDEMSDKAERQIDDLWEHWRGGEEGKQTDGEQALMLRQLHAQLDEQGKAIRQIADLWEHYRYGEEGVQTTGDGTADILDRLGRIERRVEKLEP